MIKQHDGTVGDMQREIDELRAEVDRLDCTPECAACGDFDCTLLCPPCATDRYRGKG